MAVRNYLVFYIITCRSWPPWSWLLLHRELAWKEKGHGQELGLLADRRKSPHSPGWAVPMVPGNARPAAPLLRLGTGAATAEVGSVLYATRD